MEDGASLFGEAEDKIPKQGNPVHCRNGIVDGGVKDRPERVGAAYGEKTTDVEMRAESLRRPIWLIDRSKMAPPVVDNLFVGVGNDDAGIEEDFSE